MSTLKFKAKAQELSAALARVEMVAETKTTIPILGCAHLVAAQSTPSVQVHGSSLVLTMHTSVQAEIETPGAAALPVRVLLPLLRSLTGEVTLEVNQNFHAVVKSRGGKHRVTGFNPESFPAMPEMAQNLQPVPGKLLADSIDFCEFAAEDRDTGTMQLCGVKIESSEGTLSAIGCDHHRLSVKSTQFAGALSVFLPRQALPVVKSMCEPQDRTIMVGDTSATITFATDSEMLTVRKQTGKFPEWRKFIPESRPTKAVVKSADLADALRRAVMFADKDSVLVKCSFSERGLELFSSSPVAGESEEVVQAQVTGPETVAGFNAQYLLDFAAKSLGDITFSAGAEHEGCLLAQGDWRYVVMPVALKRPEKPAKTEPAAQAAQA